MFSFFPFSFKPPENVRALQLCALAQAYRSPPKPNPTDTASIILLQVSRYRVDLLSDAFGFERLMCVVTYLKKRTEGKEEEQEEQEEQEEEDGFCSKHVKAA